MMRFTSGRSSALRAGPRSGAGDWGCGPDRCEVSTAVAFCTPGARPRSSFGLSSHRLHGRCVRAIGQQRDLDEAAAHLDPIHQPGGDNVLAGCGIPDGAQQLPQGFG